MCLWAVRAGFVCTGGCQQKGDVRRLYGECGGDKCEPMPCGWTEMRSDGRIGGAGGVLEIRQPAFTVKSVAHNNPTLNAQVCRLSVSRSTSLDLARRAVLSLMCGV